MATKTEKNGSSNTTSRIENVLLESVKPQPLTFKIVGTTALLMHKFSDAAALEMTRKANGEGGLKGSKPTDKEAFEAAIYRTEDGELYMPSGAFLGAIVEAASFMGQVTRYNKKRIKGAVKFPSDKVIITSKSGPKMRIDMGKNDKGQSVRSVRAELQDWGAEITLTIDTAIYKPAEILQLFERAGFSIGVGAWRTECGGTHGCFMVKRG